MVEAAYGETSISAVMRKLNLNANNAVARRKLQQVLDEEHCVLRPIPTQDQMLKFNLIKSAGIDFSKYGWVGEASKILNMPPQNVTRWLSKLFPNFLDTCFTRKRQQKVFSKDE